MSIVIVLICIVILILLITWGKLNAFLAFMIVSLLAGLLPAVYGLLIAGDGPELDNWLK